MELRTYRAKSIQDALRLIRQELGPDAAVIHTREVRGGMFQWLGRSREIEVTASNRIHVASRFEPLTLDSDAVEQRPAVPPPADSRSEPAVESRESDLPLANLHNLLEQVCQDETASPQIRALWKQLQDAQPNQHDVDETQEPISAENSTAPTGLGFSGPIELTSDEQRVVALIGPTGVGKTTTIAKLAAIYHLRERKRVGLVTVDTYRVAAVDQLRAYAEIIDLPMEIVSGAGQMQEALQNLSECDLILIDTAGRSPQDEVRIEELATTIDEASPDEVHLVLSTVSSLASIQQAVQRFSPLQVSRLILTKVDEAVDGSPLLDLLQSFEIPLSYLTTGQNVPQDISVANEEEILNLTPPSTSPPSD